MSGMYSNARKAYPQYYKDIDGPNGDLLASMGKKDLSAFLQALEDGADPDCRELIATRRIRISPLATICSDLPSRYPNKLDYVRPLVEKGADLLALRRQNGPESFTESVLYMGFQNYREGDEKCAAYLLAHLVADDISRGETYDLKDILSKIFATVGGSLPNNDDDRVRVQYAEAITQNQHALVDYVATSQEPVATYLRSQEDHPSSDAWMKKIEPIQHESYPRPTQAYCDKIERVSVVLGQVVDMVSDNRGAMVPEARPLLAESAALLREIGPGSLLARGWTPTAKGTPIVPPISEKDAWKIAENILDGLRKGPK